MSNEESSANIKVICRVRPLNPAEQQNNKGLINLSFQGPDQVALRKAEGGAEPMHFKFDRIFGSGHGQQEVYEQSARKVIESVLQGFNGTILAYGQTASGKTYTMTGTQNEPGIIPRMIETVFAHIDESHEDTEFMIKVSIVEIYNEKIRDLLDISKSDLKIREDKLKGVYIQEATEQYVNDEQDIELLLCQGTNNRAVGETEMNQGSSRSHMLFILEVKSKDIDLSTKVGRLYLVDLAGSEKINKTKAEGQQLQEAKKINQSLLNLGTVISALTEGQPHIPYRNSKLTRICQDSLGGNSKTTLIITCSPSLYNEAETISTLRFGLMAKKIKNQPKINRELSIEELQALLEKQTSLNKLLTEKNSYYEKLLAQHQISSDFKSEGPAETVQVAVTEQQALQYQQQVSSYQKEIDLKNEQHKIMQKKHNDTKLKLAKQAAQLLVYQKQNEILVAKLAQSSIKLEQDEGVISEKQVFIDNYQESLAKKDVLLKSLREEKASVMQEAKRHISSAIETFQKQLSSQPVDSLKEMLRFYQDGLHYEFKRMFEKEQLKKSQVESKYEQLVKDFSLLAQDKIENYDAIKRQLVSLVQGNSQKEGELEKVEVQRQMINEKLEKRLESLKESILVFEEDSRQARENTSTQVERLALLEGKVEELGLLNQQLMAENNDLVTNHSIQEQRLSHRSDTIRELEEKVMELSSKFYEFKIKNEQMKNMMTQNELGTQVYAQVIHDQEEPKEKEGPPSVALPGDINHYDSRNYFSKDNERIGRKKIISNIRGGRQHNLLYSQQLAMSMQRNYFQVQEGKPSVIQEENEV